MLGHRWLCKIVHALWMLVN